MNVKKEVSIFTSFVTLYVCFKNTKNLKNHPIKYIILSLGLFLFAQNNAFSQGKPLNPIRDTGPKTKVELLPGADSLVGLNTDFSLIQVFGNVSFRHRGSILKCRIAIQNSIANTIEAYGNIKIIQGDTLTITGDTLYYDGNTRYAKIYGKQVVLRDKKIVLETRQMNYDMNSSDAYYSTRGKITQDSSILRSNKGNYNTKTKLFNYVGDVEIMHPKYVLCTEKLDYDSNNHLATFITQTSITSTDGVINAKSGTYNTETQEANFGGRSKVANDEYTLEADTLFFNRSTDSGLAIGDVEFVSQKDKVVLTGNRAIRDGEKGLTKMMGKSLMKSFEEADTLFLRSDTLFVYEYLENELKKDSSKTDTTQQERKLKLVVADGNVKVFKTDLQSLSDSLRYDMQDSTIRFYTRPIIWSTENQLTADTIVAYLKNSKVKNVWLNSRSFVISQDTAQNFNQIKGRQIRALFSDSTDIERVFVEGNGESIYFALDEKNKLIGLNRVECSRMVLNFAKKKVSRIAFMGKPESRLIPPKQIGSQEVKLENFNWRIDEKPTKEMIIGSKFVPQNKNIDVEKPK